MAYLLFSGRHLLNTEFQRKYLLDILQLPIGKMKTLNKFAGNGDDKIDHIIFAVTSANQENSRYNPVPFYLRALGLDRFSKEYRDLLNIKFDILPIPHFNTAQNFPELLLKEISEKTEGRLMLNNKNSIVLCSTPSLVDMFKDLDFAILTSEYDFESKVVVEKIPIDYIKLLTEIENGWENDEEIKNGLSKTSISLWQDFPQIPKKILRLWKDPLLNEKGSITENRDYSTYSIGMGHKILLESKYNDIKNFIVPGKIVDEGCADGALMTFLAKDFPDSDIIGIEITSEFIARFLERQRLREFGDTFVFIHQRNLMDKIFEDNSIDTTICNSTTHEIWSYGEGRNSLDKYLSMKFAQLRKNGHIIIRDVVGPENKDQEIYVELNDRDGSNDDVMKECSDREELRDHLENISTYSKFLRFADDYLKDMRNKGQRNDETKIKFREEIVNNKKYIITSLKNASEFMTKKDYTNNWQSELNEEFAFWSFSEWKEGLSRAGFKVIENPNIPDESSRSFTIPWVIENRFKGKVKLFNKNEMGDLIEIPYPVTNMVLVGQKL